MLIAGGEKARNDRLILEAVRDTLAAGGAGVCIGRNAWHHKNPARFVRAICAMVHEGASVAQALKIIRGKK